MAKDVKPTADARERARQIAAKQAKTKSASSRRWIQLTILAVIAAIIAVIAFVVITNNKNEIPEAGPVPASANQYGGIVLTKDGIQQNTSAEPSRDFNTLGTATQSYTPTEGGTESPFPLGLQTSEEAKNNGEPVRVTIFQDYRCVHCAEFESTYGDQIEQMVLDGKITLEIRNLTFLDAGSATLYSARAANAAYSVANQVSTKDFLDYQKEIFSHQAEGGVSNQELVDIAAKYGADIKEDVNNNTWRPLVAVVNAESATNGVAGTPSVFADGEYYGTNEDFITWLTTKIETKEQA